MHTSLHAEKAEQPHAKNCTVAENCTETLHHVFCTFEAEEFIYLVLFFIFTENQAAASYMAKVFMFNYVWKFNKKNMLKISGSSFSAERRFYIW